MDESENSWSNKLTATVVSHLNVLYKNTFEFNQLAIYINTFACYDLGKLAHFICCEHRPVSSKIRALKQVLASNFSLFSERMKIKNCGIYAENTN